MDTPNMDNRNAANRDTAVRQLPAAFSFLQPFVAEWGLATEKERFYKLHTTRLEDLRPFYDAMLPRMDEILAYLNEYSMGSMPDDARVLFDLAMTFAETAHPLDLKWTDVDFNDAYPWDKFEFRTVSTADQQ
jgi:hypothetical protein